MHIKNLVKFEIPNLIMIDIFETSQIIKKRNKNYTRKIVFC